MEVPVKRRKDRELWRINFTTLPYKIHYLLFLGAVGCILPFMAVFSMWKFGLSGSQVASIFATQQFLTVLTKPAIGAIVDRFNKMKLIMITLIVLQMFFFFMLLAIPGAEEIPSVHVNQHRYSVAFTLDCDPTSNIDEMPCQLKEAICYSLKHMEDNANSSGKDECSLPSDRRGSDLCRNEEFLCCGSEEQFVPHSLKKETLLCKKSFIDSSSQLADVYNGSCIPFTATKNHMSSRIQGHVLPMGITVNVTATNETFFVCAHGSEPNVKMTSNDSTSTAVFLRTHETSYQCRTNQDSHCGPLTDVIEASMDSCKFRSNSTGDSPQCSSRSNRQSMHKAYNIWIFAVLAIGGMICVNSMFTLSDTACHESLQKCGGDYGRQRVCGSVAFGMMSPFAGMLNDVATEASGHPNYTPGFYVFGVLATLQILNMIRLDLAKPNLRGNVFKQVGALFKSPTFVMFEFGALMMGFFSGVIWFYLLIFLQSIGSSKLLMGLVVTMECVFGELPVMYFSGWILKRTGYMNALVLGFLCFSLRFIWYHFLYNPWWILPVEITHGICYGLFYPALTSFAKSSAPKGTEATTQSILGCTFSSLGSGLGCVVTGVCFDHFGSRSTFLALSVLSLTAAIIQFSGSTLLRRRTRSKPVHYADDSEPENT